MSAEWSGIPVSKLELKNHENREEGKRNTDTGNTTLKEILNEGNIEWTEVECGELISFHRKLLQGKKVKSIACD